METETRTIWTWLREIAAGWPALLGCMLLCLLAAVLATAGQPTEYEAQGSVVVSPQRFLEAEGTDALPALTENVVRLTTTPAVLNPAALDFIREAPNAGEARRRKQDTTLSSLRKQLRVGEVGQSSVIEISGKGPTPDAAMDLTRATVASLTRFVASARGADPDSSDQAQKSDGLIVLSAGEAKGQVSPTFLRNIALAINAGLLLGGLLAIALGRRRLSQRRSRARRRTAAAV